ncbi:Squalene epoxidase [Aspergillus nanangensis]|uniref:Squalene monooxygenase n=1 Tax=Aspergillus nanangensis TaxID=2582783 RepID=A0AAD4D058_ASPNN|nr:Squalene epoxidase [Aspergillus nanangensis]
MTTITPSHSSTFPVKQQFEPPDPREARRRLHHEADIVIVGAGVSGCAAAVAFGNQGRSVILLEKSLDEPERVVGELLQPGGVGALRELGMEDCLEGIDAVPCHGYWVSYYREPVNIPYPKPIDGPRPEGRSFHHGRFIQNLRQAVRRSPNVMLVEAKVTEMVRQESTGTVLGVMTETTEKKKDCYFGSLTLICDGVFSGFRKDFLPYKPSSRSKFFALELLDAELPRPQYGHVLLSNAPPILIYQIGPRTTRIFMDVPEDLPSASPAVGGVKSHMLKVVLPELPPGCRPSFEHAVAHGKLRSMPNSFLPPSVPKTPGVLILGDAMNMRHPLTGGGMTIAFQDVLLLSQMLSPENVPSLQDQAAVQAQLARFHWDRKRSSSLINILAMALYALFAAASDGDPALAALKNGCFRYFQRGGRCVDEPCGMLAGIIHSPAVLLYHFFSVAFYAIWLRLCEAPIWLKPWALVVEGVMVLWRASMVIGPYLVWEVRW